MSKFSQKRTVRHGETEVQTGFRGENLQFRLRLPTGQVVSLGIDAANDLADCLDEVIDMQEQEPLT